MSARIPAVTIIATPSTLVLSACVLHRHLGKRVKHSFLHAFPSSDACLSDTIPEDVHRNTSKYEIVYDRACTAVPSDTLPPFDDEDV